MDKDIAHIVFDIGRVLIQWDPEIPFTRLIPDAAERRHFLEEICSPAWNLEQDRGRPFAEAEAVLIDEHPEWESQIRAYRQHWMEMIPGPIVGTIEIMTDLIDRGHDVTLLTNFSQETFPLACNRFPSLRRPRGVTVSGEVQLLKPDLAIYQQHHAQFDLEPSRTIFFDDSPHNVHGAEEAGWHARLFTDVVQMRSDFAELGIDV